MRAGLAVLIGALCWGQAFAGLTEPGVRLGPVRSQGDVRNTCSAFAATALIEFLLTERDGTTTRLSEQWAYYAAKRLALETPLLRSFYERNDGMAGFLAVEAYARAGAMAASEWPYELESDASRGVAGCGGKRPPTRCFTGTPPAGASTLAGFAVEPEAIDRFRIADFLLHERRPVVVNLKWYFEAAPPSGELRLPDPNEIEACRARGEGCAGHVVLLTGYDPAARRFRFRNSWGERWGVRGYGTLPETFVAEHCEVCEHLGAEALSRLSPDERAFVLRASQGTSARLISAGR